MFRAYLDESGDPAGKTGAFAVAGTLSTIQKWLRFEPQWRSVLRSHGVSSGIFHMQECAAGTGEYKGWTTENRRILITALSDCLARHAKHAFSAAVVLEGWHQINREFKLAEFFGQPYSFCGRLAASCVKSWMRQHNLTAPVEYIFEDGMKGKGKGEFLNLVSKHDRFTPTFMPKELPGSQAADLIVWKNRRIAQDLVTRPFGMIADQVKSSLAPISRILRKYWVLDEQQLLEFCLRHHVPHAV
jgi:hypothetical protein